MDGWSCNADNICVPDTGAPVINVSPFDFCQDGNPIGGDSGYDRILSSADADIHITSFTTITAFKNTIEGASVGDVIFIDGSLTIDLMGLNEETGEGTIYVPEGVTIASDRGISSGALLIKHDHYDTANTTANPVDDANPIFLAAGPDVRITGIRFEGGFDNIGLYPGTTSNYGVGSVDQDNFEVDNCEFANFRAAGVVVGSPSWIAGTTYPTFTTGSSVHHNFMRENNTRSRGYGVAVANSDTEIYANRFYWNHHDIIGLGAGTRNFEAYCNTHEVNEDGAGGTHPNVSVSGEGGDGGVAGDDIWIHHNDFEDSGYSGIGTHSLSGAFRNVIVRGTPATLVLIENNRVALADQNTISPWPFQQRDESRTISVRFTVQNNIYDGAAVPSCRDGMQNQDETGIDCGGSCPACS